MDQTATAPPGTVPPAAEVSSQGVTFGHVNLPSADLERSIAFYATHFGFQRGPAFRDEAGREQGIFLYLSRGMFMELFPCSDIKPWQGHLCLAVDDLRATVIRLRAAGVEVNDICLGRSKGWMAFLRDPDGHALELNEYSHPESWIAQHLRAHDPRWLPTSAERATTDLPSPPR